MPIDYKKYPANWKTEIRPFILKRDNNKCKFCGLENSVTVYKYRLGNKTHWTKDRKHIYKVCNLKEIMQSVFYKPIKVVLTIAHLDHDETNHNVSMERLAALCQLCHLRYDAREKYLRSISKLIK